MNQKHQKAKGSQYSDTFIVAPEDIDINVCYSLTINPSDDFQFFNSSSRLNQSREWMEYILFLYGQKIYINIFQEVSRRGRIHYHGKIKFKTIEALKTFYVEHLHNLLSKAHIEIDTISNPEEWDEYCRKSDKLWGCNIGSSTAYVRFKDKLLPSYQTSIVSFCEDGSQKYYNKLN